MTNAPFSSRGAQKSIKNNRRGRTRYTRVRHTAIIMEAQKPAAKYALSSHFSSRALSQNADDRKRKITDKNLPNALLQNPEFAQESAMYQDLLQMERKLDWTMTRKRVEVHDALQRIIAVSTFVKRFRGLGGRVEAEDAVGGSSIQETTVT